MGRLCTAFSAAFLALGGFLFGYDSGIISSTIAQPHFKSHMGSPSTSSTGGIVSSFTGGAILGSLSIAYLADSIGRKKTVFVGSLISTLGCALQGGASNIAMMVAGRFVAGVATGLLSAVIPMYCSELAMARDRGMLAGLLQFMISCGFFTAQWVGFACFHVNGEFQWRFPLAVQVLPAVVLGVGVWFLVDSPRWLVSKERVEEAREVLVKLHGDGTNQDFLDLEFQEIRDTILAEKQTVAEDWFAIFKRASWRKRLLLGMGIQAFGQLSGVNVITYYGPVIYSLLGISVEESLKIIGISGSLSIMWCAIGLILLDRIGRIKPMIFATTGCAVALLINAVLSQRYVVTHKNKLDTTPSSHTNNTALRAIVSTNFLFSFFFTMIGIITWVFPSEIYPAEIRARGNSLATFTNWSLNLVLAQCAPLALDRMGFKFFYVFVAFNLVAVACYLLFYPETKGRTLEEMNEVFGDQDETKGRAVVVESDVYGNEDGKLGVSLTEVVMDM